MATIRTNEEGWARIEGLIHALRLRGEGDSADEVERELRSNMGLTDGWHMMLDGLEAARSSGQGRLTPDEQADLDETIDAVQKG